MNWAIQGFLLLIFLIIPQHGKAGLQLREADVRPAMEEIFRYHVEFKELSPLLAKRSFKVYIEQFDPDKIYLLEEEVKPYLEPGQEKLGRVIKNYYDDDFSAFLELNALLEQGILRARSWRREIERELILEIQPPKDVAGESYLQFASGESTLKQRIKRQLLRALSSEGESRAPSPWTPEKREKIFSLWEKKLAREERAYLILEQGKFRRGGEHFLALHVLKALAKSLDSHTAYFSPDEALEMRMSLEKQFEGIGVLLRESIEGVVVVDLVKGGPAERCGEIVKGDLIVEVNGKSLDAISYEEVLAEMKGDRNKQLNLVFKRIQEGGKEKFVRVLLQCEKIVMSDERLRYSSEDFGEGLIGKLKLSSFYESGEGESCETDIRAAIKNLKKEGKLIGLILDMRENSGGFLNQAVKVAGLFITSGVIVISKYSGGEVQYLRDLDGRVYYSGPLLILTSRASASAAEIVAQSLQDYGAALIVGDERTYGKGTIQYQTVTDDDADIFYKVTVGRYYTVSGRSTQIEGVKADIVVPTEFSIYNIGERFLEYPLKSDSVSSVYIDPLTDIEQGDRRWFQKNYLPHLQRREPTWRNMLPRLLENSSHRLKKDKNYAAFLKGLDGSGGEDSSLDFSKNNWGIEDLQMTEAVHIVKDMIILQSGASSSEMRK